MMSRYFLVAMVIFVSNTHAMLYRTGKPTLHQPRKQSRLYTTSTKDIAALYTRIYDPSKSAAPAVAKIQQHFHDQYTASAQVLVDQISDHSKKTHKELEELTYDIRQEAKKCMIPGNWEPLSTENKQAVHVVLDELGLDSSQVRLISASVKIGEGILTRYRYMKSYHDIIQIDPGLLKDDKKTASSYKLACMVGNIVQDASVLYELIFKLDLSDELIQKICDFSDMRSTVFALTRGKKWAHYGVEWSELLKKEYYFLGKDKDYLEHHSLHEQTALQISELMKKATE